MNVVLSWSGANTNNVEVIRDGAYMTTTANDGSWRQSIKKAASSYDYQICETGSGDCSEVVTASR